MSLADNDTTLVLPDDSSGDDSTLTDNLPPETRLLIYNFVLFSPFILIPAFIVGARLCRYAIRLVRAKLDKSDENEEDLLQDPLGELGLSIGTDDETLKEARRLRLEMRRLKALQREALNGSDARSPDEPREKENLSQIRIQLASFGKKTQTTWNQKLSPEAVRRFFDGTRYGRLWMMFQVLCTVISIINYIILTYRVVREEHRNIKRLDLFLTFVFLSDYIISMYMAEDRLQFYVHPMSLIDLLSILPPIVYYIVKDVSSSVWFLGLIRIFRATRILRTYRLLSFSQSEESRELAILGLTFVNFLFLSASIINALESLELNHGPPTLTTWHDSLYYIMVTFSTIGFGDLTPSSTVSRGVVMVLIVVMIIFVPLQTSRLSEIYNSTSYYQRQKYVPDMRHAHVVVSGPGVSFAAMADFCREYFTADPHGHVVILCPDEPDFEIRRLLRHPNYRQRLYYLAGSTLNVGDLKRAGADFATAFFLLSGDNVAETGMQDGTRLRSDAHVLMQTLTVKTAFPRVPVFAQVQETRTAELAVHCGCDRVLCLDEIKMALLARDCLVPGTLAMLQNLVHTYARREQSPKSGDLWIKEYTIGATNQLSSLKVPSGLIGVYFKEAAAMIYSEVGATLIGVLPASSNLIALNPGHAYCIKPDDVLVCIAESNTEVVLRIMLHFETKPTSNPFNLPQKTVADSESSSVSKNAQESRLGKAAVSNRWGSLHLLKPKSEDRDASIRSPASIEADVNMISGLSNHIILCGCVRARGLRHLIHCIRSAEADRVEVTPIVILVEELPDTTQSIWDDITSYRRVHLLQGTPLKRQSLVVAGIGTCRRIVIFQTSVGDNAQSALADANSIFIVKLIQEEWPAAAFLVELSSGSNTRYFSVEVLKASLSRQETTAMLRDYALGTRERLALYYRSRTKAAKESDMMLRLWKFISGVRPTSSHSDTAKSDVAKRSYTRLNDNETFTGPIPSDDSQGTSLTMNQLAKFEEEAELTESGLSAFPSYQFDAQFAAGRVATAALAHSLLCQTYLRPYAIDVIAHLTATIIHMKVPPSLVGKTYGELVLYHLYRDVVVVGLFRGGAGWEAKRQQHTSGTTANDRNDAAQADSALAAWSAALHESNSPSKLAEDLTTKLPYVYTNCRGYEVVSQNDLVFALPSAA
ncbi:hypothetical protein SeMB42_g06350 [Synchytrium endobioticum]|uniref:BK channel n=1 Tax=Synchytrium endobioticum TaxID=286115 RepID=A0A507CJ40_9FUNG|nr:hypothetical protein SeMB42_g06350 [Synchytrium endobioticum]TPX39667.1 hypothetical protein SeLEV6574_g07066 [Synchytrium endobioticum]